MKLLIVIVLASGLAGCSPAPPEVPASISSGSPSPASANGRAAALEAPSGFPKDCQAYLDRVKGCVARQRGAIADAVRAGAEQTQAGWAALPRTERAEACKTSLTAFAAQAPALGC